MLLLRGRMRVVLNPFFVIPIKASPLLRRQEQVAHVGGGSTRLNQLLELYFPSHASNKHIMIHLRRPILMTLMWFLSPSFSKK
ncbi:Uncharacterised protein [Legionella oakridgensis]|nr:Uncharacterised protein [Legionella oakridgensis]